MLISPLTFDEVRAQSLTSMQARPFHLWSRRRQNEQSAERKSGASATAEAAEAKTESAADEEAAGKRDDKASSGDEGESKKEGSEKKDELPPPPPHGDKTPWQVFLDTMQSEFKASKEWNESTKALASSAHQFTESESVRRAREAYDATTGAVSSTAGKVLKTTAAAVGKTAQWVGETPVAKGVAKAASVTGEVLDKATRPIRETETYKNVRDVIDDGSSSRYGGWVEKEERRRRREMREREAAKNGMKPQAFQEDPK